MPVVPVACFLTKILKQERSDARDRQGSCGTVTEPRSALQPATTKSNTFNHNKSMSNASERWKVVGKISAIVDVDVDVDVDGDEVQQYGVEL